MDNSKPPRCYSFLFVLWSLGFWTMMFVGALHGLIIKGPVLLLKNKEVWEKSDNLNTWHWIVLAFILVFFSYCEGYRGFQLAWSPMLVKRSYHFSAVASPIYDLTKNIYTDRVIDFILGPMLAGGFICGTRRRLALSWGITIFVCILILLMRYMSDLLPWKCFIDTGVVVGLSWGFIFILIWWIKIGLFDCWPDFVPDEYPDYFTASNQEHVLIKVKKRSSRTNSDSNNLLEEVVSTNY